MATPTKEQFAVIAVEVNKRLLPAVVLESQVNADYVIQRMERAKASWTADNIVATIWQLYKEGKILWDIDPVAPPTPTPAQKQAALTKRLLAKQHEKDLEAKNENSPAAVAARNAAAANEQKAKNDAKELASLKGKIIREITSYTKGHQSGHQDYAGTQSGRDTLLAVLNGFGRVTFNDMKDPVDVNIVSVEAAKRALLAVEKAKVKLP